VWYNTNYHTSLKCNPFEALYGYCPLVPGPDSPAAEFLTKKQNMINTLRENLAQAQARIKKYVDNKRTEREFVVGDMAYLKLQPFRHHVFGLHQSLKLTTKYYGPFRILERIGATAYKLQLTTDAGIHHVFHVSQLKKHLGPRDVPQNNLPLITSDGYIKIEHVVVLDTRALPHNDNIITQWKIHWQNLTEEQATWEDKHFISPHSQCSTPTLSSNGGLMVFLVDKQLLKRGRGLPGSACQCLSNTQRRRWRENRNERPG
jgi:hypothetical protein